MRRARAYSFEPEPFGASGDVQIDPHLSSDGWPYPDIALGQQTAPTSIEECEARILRAYRTSDAQRRVGHGPGSFCGDIPSDMVKIALMTAAREREREERREGRAPDLEAVRSGWTPGERDKEDWTYALAWLNGVDRRALRILALRAADPPWSFRQIAERLRLGSHETVRARYLAALRWAFEVAQTNGGHA